MEKTKDKRLKLTSLSSSILFLVAIIGGVIETLSLDQFCITMPLVLKVA